MTNILINKRTEEQPRMEADDVYSLKNIIQIYSLHVLTRARNSDHSSSNEQL